MVDFLSEASNIEEMIAEIQKAILFELTNEFSDVRFYDDKKLARSLKDIFAKTGDIKNYDSDFKFVANIDLTYYVSLDCPGATVTCENYTKADNCDLVKK